jgi:tetratricopeptide (TPR) repeat protein
MHRSTFAAIALAVALALCGPAHAALDIEEYLERAEAARKRSDWQALASNMAEVLNHRDLPRDAITRSHYHLEYGRAMGVLCRWGEAEMFLARGKDVAEKGGVSTALALYELASIAVAQNKTEAAGAHFAALMPLIGRGAKPALSSAQADDAYRKYADVLSKLGKADEATAMREKASGKSSTPATPYGTRCAR